MKQLVITLYFILFTNILCAEIVKKIEIDGNDRVSDETIKVYGDISINQDIDNFKINEVIKNLYSTNFFEDIQISLSNGTLFIKVEEYPVINEIIIIGEKAEKYKEAIKKNIQSKKMAHSINHLLREMSKQ